MRTTLLLVSLLLSAWLAVRLAWPLPPSLWNCRADDGPWMTCQQTEDVERTKDAAMAFAQGHDDSLFKSHAFMTASGYDLEGMTAIGDRTYFS